MKLFKKAYYEKLMMQNPKTVQDYHLIIANAQEKIKEIQEKCAHSERFVGYYSWRIGSFHPSRICKACNAWIESATTEEADTLRKESGLTYASESDTVFIGTREEKKKH